MLHSGRNREFGSEFRRDIPFRCTIRRNVGSITEKSITAELDLPLHTGTAEIAFPCLITVEKGIFEPRLPSYKRKLATRDREITVLTLDDMPDKDPKHYGLNGSPTQVKRIFPPENHHDRQMWEGNDEELAGKLFAYLENGKYLQQLR